MQREATLYELLEVSPHASARQAQISLAYAILSDPLNASAMTSAWARSQRQSPSAGVAN